MEIPYDLTCWYLNARRIVELTGSKVVIQRVSESGASGNHLQRLAELEALKEAVISWMQAENPHPLRMLSTAGELAAGRLFTHNSNFFFKGLSAAGEAIRKGKSIKPAIGYSKIEDWRSGGKLQFEFHPDHLTSNSSWSELAGQKRMFVLGLITNITDSVITAVPYVLANIVHNKSEMWSREHQYWQNHLELHIDEIDNFSNVRNFKRRLTKKSLDTLKKIPEKDVKQAFARIIGEPHVPKDWGGESSDLFSTHVTVDGKRISTAFAFKGPSKFRPMAMAELGKNGDQISRLFSEPADLYVLQHCHQVTNDVRATMRAFSQQMGRTRLFCIVDGFDTIRVLETYQKCGLGQAPNRKNTRSSERGAQ